MEENMTLLQRLFIMLTICKPNKILQKAVSPDQRDARYSFCHNIRVDNDSSVWDRLKKPALKNANFDQPYQWKCRADSTLA